MTHPTQIAMTLHARHADKPGSLFHLREETEHRNIFTKHVCADCLYHNRLCQPEETLDVEKETRSLSCNQLTYTTAGKLKIAKELLETSGDKTWKPTA